jgi:hypothetical protein
MGSPTTCFPPTFRCGWYRALLWTGDDGGKEKEKRSREESLKGDSLEEKEMFRLVGSDGHMHVFDLTDHEVLFYANLMAD